MVREASGKCPLRRGTRTATREIYHKFDAFSAEPMVTMPANALSSSNRRRASQEEEAPPSVVFHLLSPAPPLLKDKEKEVAAVEEGEAIAQAEEEGSKLLRPPPVSRLLLRKTVSAESVTKQRRTTRRMRTGEFLGASQATQPEVKQGALRPRTASSTSATRYSTRCLWAVRRLLDSVHG